MSLVFGWALLVLLGTWSVNANALETCPAIVQNALEATDERCEGLGRNQVCYGARSVRASFFEAVNADAFDEPADVVGLEGVSALATDPVNLETGEVGVAVMRIQALLPNTLPGQAVIMVLVGDMQLENAVTEDAVNLSDPIRVTATVSSNLRAEPSSNGAVLSSVPPGAALLVDGINTEGDWLRVVNDGLTRWISRDLVATDADLNRLTVISPDSYGTMQAFTLRGGVGNSDCEEASEALMVQSPQGTRVTLNVNGRDVTIGSSVVFQPTEDHMNIGVLEGYAELDNGQVVVPGFFASALTDPETGEITGDWNPPTLFSQTQAEEFEAFEAVPDELLNYTIESPEQATLDILRELEREGVAYNTLRDIPPDQLNSEFNLDEFINLPPTRVDDLTCEAGACLQPPEIACRCALCGVACPSGDGFGRGGNDSITPITHGMDSISSNTSNNGGLNQRSDDPNGGGSDSNSGSDDPNGSGNDSNSGSDGNPNRGGNDSNSDSSGSNSNGSGSGSSGGGSDSGGDTLGGSPPNT
jgi:hypothetical protein